MLGAARARKARGKGYRRGTPLGEFGTLLPWLVVPACRETRSALFEYLGAVVRDFFGLQWAVKLAPPRHTLPLIPVVHVDHFLDAAVPFRPGAARVYLDFVNLWIRGLSLALSRLGVKRGVPVCARYLRLLSRAYREAARVYRRFMSTTDRPRCRDFRIRAIRFADPHLLCVPSLHIAIVTLTWGFYRREFAANPADFPPADAERFLAGIWSGAVEIAETVVAVRQHSINCIPAALYMVSRIAPDFFTCADAEAFAAALFADDPDIPPKLRFLIVEHIKRLFSDFRLGGEHTDDWTVPVIRWLSARYCPPLRMRPIRA